MSNQRIQRESTIGCTSRLGYTLLEVMTVVVLLGVLALAAAGRFRPESIGDLDGQVTAHRLAWDLRRARRAAIASGDNHALTFQNGGGTLTGYTLQRRLPDTSLTTIDSPLVFPKYVTVTTATASPEFTFEGEALASYTFSVTTPHKSWTITVAQATGSVRVQ